MHMQKKHNTSWLWGPKYYTFASFAYHEKMNGRQVLLRFSACSSRLICLIPKPIGFIFFSWPSDFRRPTGFVSKTGYPPNPSKSQGLSVYHHFPQENRLQLPFHISFHDISWVSTKKHRSPVSTRAPFRSTELRKCSTSMALRALTASQSSRTSTCSPCFVDHFLTAGWVD